MGRNSIISDELKNKVIHEYHTGIIPVKQLTYKYGISIRTVYNWVEKGNRRGKHRVPRKALFLDKKEVETLLKAISETRSPSPALRSVESRLLQIADDLPPYSESTDKAAEHPSLP